MTLTLEDDMAMMPEAQPIINVEYDRALMESVRHRLEADIRALMMNPAASYLVAPEGATVTTLPRASTEEPSPVPVRQPGKRLYCFDDD